MMHELNNKDFASQILDNKSKERAAHMPPPVKVEPVKTNSDGNNSIQTEAGKQ